MNQLIFAFLALFAVAVNSQTPPPCDMYAVVCVPKQKCNDTNQCQVGNAECLTPRYLDPFCGCPDSPYYLDEYGRRCQSDSYCNHARLRCYLNGPSRHPKCRLADGEYCFHDDHCGSGYCDKEYTKTCMDKPSTPPPCDMFEVVCERRQHCIYSGECTVGNSKCLAPRYQSPFCACEDSGYLSDEYGLKCTAGSCSDPKLECKLSLPKPKCRLANDQYCFGYKTCASNYCDKETKKCAPAAVLIITARQRITEPPELIDAIRADAADRTPEQLQLIQDKKDEVIALLESLIPGFRVDNIVLEFVNEDGSVNQAKRDAHADVSYSVEGTEPVVADAAAQCVALKSDAQADGLEVDNCNYDGVDV